MSRRWAAKAGIPYPRASGRWGSQGSTWTCLGLQTSSRGTQLCTEADSDPLLPPSISTLQAAHTAASGTHCCKRHTLQAAVHCASLPCTPAFSHCPVGIGRQAPTACSLAHPAPQPVMHFRGMHTLWSALWSRELYSLFGPHRYPGSCIHSLGSISLSRELYSLFGQHIAIQGAVLTLWAAYRYPGNCTHSLGSIAIQGASAECAPRARSTAKCPITMSLSLMAPRSTK